MLHEGHQVCLQPYMRHLWNLPEMPENNDSEEGASPSDAVVMFKGLPRARGKRCMDFCESQGCSHLPPPNQHWRLSPIPALEDRAAPRAGIRLLTSSGNAQRLVLNKDGRNGLTNAQRDQIKPSWYGHFCSNLKGEDFSDV